MAFTLKINGTPHNAGFLYWRYMPAKVDYANVYEHLGISPLSSNIEALPQIQKRLDQLSREACYVDAITDLSKGLIKLGYPREAATSLRSFVKRCKNSDSLLRIAYSALERVSDYGGALEVADQLVHAGASESTRRLAGI